MAETFCLLLLIAIVIFIVFINGNQKKLKEKKLKSLSMQLESVLEDVYFSLQINVTQNKLIKVQSKFPVVEKLYEHADVNLSKKLFLDRICDDEFQTGIKEEINNFLLPESLITFWNEGQRSKRYEIQIKSESLGLIWVELKISVLKSDDLVLFIYLTNINQRKQKELQLKRTSELDPLIGINNRTTFMNMLEQEMLSGRKYKSALCIIDIDNFKSVNDTFGHEVGDEIIILLAEKIKESMRKTDFIGRLGGDEIFIYLADIPERKIIENRLQKLQENVRTIKLPDNKNLTCSIGAYYFDINKQIDFHELYSKTDKVLYDVKKVGKNKFEIEEEV